MPVDAQRESMAWQQKGLSCFDLQGDGIGLHFRHCQEQPGRVLLQARGAALQTAVSFNKSTSLESQTRQGVVFWSWHPFVWFFKGTQQEHHPTGAQHCKLRFPLGRRALAQRVRPERVFFLELAPLCVGFKTVAQREHHAKWVGLQALAA